LKFTARSTDSQSCVTAFEEQAVYYSDFIYTAPFSISEKDDEQVRKEIGLLIEKIAKRVETSDPTVMATINIDLFQS
jgi:hypothetical protein